MNVLILNWRDPQNLKSGGAEKLNLQIISPLLKRGDSVTWYAIQSGNLPKISSFNGIKIIRSGNVLTHYLIWPFYLWSGKFGKVDLIIDSIHGTGYLSTIFAPFTNKIILICEVAQNIWDEMYPFPVNLIGKVWEKIMFVFYKKQIFWTISNSTKKDLERFGIMNKKIKVIPMGFDGIKAVQQKKYKEATALFVGRLAEMKGIKDAIQAIAVVNQREGIKWRLNIIGRGEDSYEKELKGLVSSLKMNEFITFFGFVNEIKKFEEMAKSWILVVPSSREGWGMIVPEANSIGTAVLGYNVSGLHDVMQAYAKENILISPSVESIVKALEAIHRPPLVKNRPLAGWSDLHDFVKSNLAND